MKRIMGILRILRPPPVRASRITGNGYVAPFAYAIQWAWLVLMRGIGLAR